MRYLRRLMQAPCRRHHHGSPESQRRERWMRG